MLAVFLLAVALGRAQSVAPASDKTAESALVLSPFEVSASGDIGYIATNSLAGSRLNSALKDT